MDECKPLMMVRTLRRDISQYNQLETVEEAAEETGWKLVHGDVFRPPRLPGLLSVYVGTGVQLLGRGLHSSASQLNLSRFLTQTSHKRLSTPSTPT